MREIILETAGDVAVLDRDVRNPRTTMSCFAKAGRRIATCQAIYFTMMSDDVDASSIDAFTPQC